jgi:hypothetical protein
MSGRMRYGRRFGSSCVSTSRPSLPVTSREMSLGHRTQKTLTAEDKARIDAKREFYGQPPIDWKEREREYKRRKYIGVGKGLAARHPKPISLAPLPPERSQ